MNKDDDGNYVIFLDCPHCGKKTNRSTASPMDEDNKPCEGDVSVCSGCFQASVFNEDLKLIKVDESIYNDIELSRKIHIIQVALKMATRMKND